VNSKFYIAVINIVDLRKQTQREVPLMVFSRKYRCLVLPDCTNWYDDNVKPIAILTNGDDDVSE
jgi:hypothetical protein